jgi:type II secretory pathway pseudopilin PulG
MNARGFSLIEATIVLAAAAIVAGTLAPVGKTVTDRARMIRAGEDEAAIRDALRTFLWDVKHLNRQIKIEGKNHNKGDVLELLVSDGDIPRETSLAGDAAWQEPVSPDGVVDFLERYLATNDPAGDAANAWRPPHNFNGHGKGWRGAYISAPVQPDPWGNRYAVNMGFLGHKAKPSVVVFSAGPDEVIETSYAARGLTAGGDDIVTLVD